VGFTLDEAMAELHLTDEDLAVLGEAGKPLLVELLGALRRRADAGDPGARAVLLDVMDAMAALGGPGVGGELREALQGEAAPLQAAERAGVVAARALLRSRLLEAGRARGLDLGAEPLVAAVLGPGGGAA
jgi:hypothetical protein